jgi:hypothetical protein
MTMLLLSFTSRQKSRDLTNGAVRGSMVDAFMPACVSTNS